MLQRRKGNLPALGIEFEQRLLHDILGIRPDYDGLVIDPCIPDTLSGYAVTRFFRGSWYHITVRNPHHKEKGITALTINGKPCTGNKVPFTEGQTDVYIDVVM